MQSGAVLCCPTHRCHLLCRAGHWVTATPTDLSMIRDTLGICTYLDLRNGQDRSRVSHATALLKVLWVKPSSAFCEYRTLKVSMRAPLRVFLELLRARHSAVGVSPIRPQPSQCRGTVSSSKPDLSAGSASTTTRPAQMGGTRPVFREAAAELVLEL